MRFMRGFTLIELLVTITIISILASIIYVSFGDARQNSNNKAMMVELKEVQLALETYHSQHRKYPQPEPGCGMAPMGQLIARDSGAGSWCEGGYMNSNPAVEPTLIPQYITELPTGADSANPNCDLVYHTDAAGTWYKLTAVNCLAGVDAVSGLSPGAPLARCAAWCEPLNSGDTCHPSDSDYYQSFAVYSQGGACM